MRQSYATWIIFSVSKGSHLGEYDMGEQMADSAMHTDVLVIGAGVVGAAIAYELSRQAVGVCVVDRGPDVGHGCSYANAGLLSPGHVEPLTTPDNVRVGLSYLLQRDSPFHITPKLTAASWLARFVMKSTPQRARILTNTMQALARESLLHHGDYARAGIGSRFRQQGSLDVYLTPKHFDAAARKLGSSGREGSKLLSADEARALEPALGDISGAILHPDDASCETQAFVRECLRVACEEKGRVCWNTDVHRVIVKQNRATGVQTSAGTITADHIVVAAGLWSNELTAPLGVHIPLLGGKGYVVDVALQEHPRLPLTFKEPKVVATPFSDRLRISGTMDLGDTSDRILSSRVSAMRRATRVGLPHVDTSRPIQVWVGQRPCTADGIPVVGRVAHLPNVHIAAGHGMWGLVLAPATGVAIASGVIGNEVHKAWEDFSPNRFSRGR